MGRLLLVLLFAIGPFALAAPARGAHLIESEGAPSALVSKLLQYLDAGKRLDAIAIDTMDRWVVVAEDYRYYSNASHFDANGLRPAIEAARSAGKRVRAIAFDAQGDWLLIGDGLLQTNDRVEFGRHGLWSALEARRAAGVPVTAFGRDRVTGAYAFVAGGVHYATAISSAAASAFADARGAQRAVTDLAFGPGRFVVATYGRTVAAPYQGVFRPILDRIRTLGFDVEKALLIGSSGHLFVASDRRPELSAAQADADRFERSFGGLPGVGSHIEGAMAAQRIPGAVVARLKDGRIFWVRGYGLLEAGTDRFTRHDSIFPAASMSKVVAGLLGARLDEAGLIDLDQPVFELVGHSNDGAFSAWWNLVIDPAFLGLPGLEQVATLFRERSSKLTMRLLLQHLGGLSLHGIGLFPADDQPSLEEILLDEADLGPVDFSRAPGLAWDYSGGGYTVFEALLEELLGEDYETLAFRWVLSPAGVSVATSGFGVPHDEDRAAIGTNANGTSRGDLEDCPGEAAGGLVTTASEYARVVAALRNAARGDRASVFSEAVAREVLTRAIVVDGAGAPTTCVRSDECDVGESCLTMPNRAERICAAIPVDVDSASLAPRSYGLGVNLGATVSEFRLPKDFSHAGTQPGYSATFRVAVTDSGDGFVLLTNGFVCSSANSTCARGGGAAFRTSVDTAMQNLW